MACYLCQKGKIVKNKFRHDKFLGQNFLKNEAIIEKILSFAGPISGKNVIEIGPGLGSMTSLILNQNPKNLIAIEMDRRCASFCANKFRDRASIILGDALHVDETKIVENGCKIIANLPYNISIPLLFKWVKTIDFFQDITILIQKEVANRVVAVCGKEFGLISIAVIAYCDVALGTIVKAGSFVPMPKVDGSVVKIWKKEKPLTKLKMECLMKFANLLFANRRKQIGVILRSHKIICPSWLNPMARPDAISAESICRLTEEVHESCSACM